MFIVFLMKLCIFNNFELMTFYHVQGHLLISNVIYQVHMNLFNLDQSTMGQLS